MKTKKSRVGLDLNTNRDTPGKQTRSRSPLVNNRTKQEPETRDDKSVILSHLSVTMIAIISPSKSSMQEGGTIRVSNRGLMRRCQDDKNDALREFLIHRWETKSPCSHPLLNGSCSWITGTICNYLLSAWEMFKNEYQGGPCVEIFSASGRDPGSKWKLPSTGLEKEFDKEVLKTNCWCWNDQYICAINLKFVPSPSCSIPLLWKRQNIFN